MDKFIRTTRHLTMRELDRLLHHRRLSEYARDVIWFDMDMEASYLAGVAAGQMAETGRSINHRTAYERYCAAHPVHGPVYLPPCPGGCGMRADLTCECEIPF